MGLISWIIGGFLVGLISQALVKGPHNLGCLGTIGLGIIGSIVGGTVWNLVNDRGAELQAGGFFASILGAVLVLVLARVFNPGVRR